MLDLHTSPSWLVKVLQVYLLPDFHAFFNVKIKDV